LWPTFPPLTTTAECVLVANGHIGDRLRVTQIESSEPATA
jgi:hypothetical protein